MVYDVYSITYKHKIYDGAQEIAVEEPLVIKQMYEASHGYPAIVINNMMDRMKAELLARYSEEGR